MRSASLWGRLLFAVAFFAATLPACNESGGLMRLYGYTELLPPSTLLAPGALVVITSHKGEPLKTKLLCGPRASLGARWRPRISDTVTRSLEKLQGHTFDLSANLLDRLRTSSKFKHIRKISATLDNPRLIELDDDDVLKNLKYRSASCQAAVRLRQARGYAVTMVSSALQADSVYTVEFDSNIEMTTPELRHTMAQLAVELGAGTSSVTTEKISAKGLIWGVRDDAFLASLTDADFAGEMDDRPARHEPQLLAADGHRPQALDQDADAPLVRPPAEMTPAAPVLDGGEELVWAHPSVEPRLSGEALDQGIVIETPESDEDVD